METLVLLGSEQEENLQIRTRAQRLLKSAKGLRATRQTRVAFVTKVMNVLVELLEHCTLLSLHERVDAILNDNML